MHIRRGCTPDNNNNDTRVKRDYMMAPMQLDPAAGRSNLPPQVPQENTSQEELPP